MNGSKVVVRQLSFSAAASLAGLSFEDFAARLREHFDTGFRLDEQVVDGDIQATVVPS